jgi:hypothetical protein
MLSPLPAPQRSPSPDAIRAQRVLRIGAQSEHRAPRFVKWEDAIALPVAEGSFRDAQQFDRLPGPHVHDSVSSPIAKAMPARVMHGDAEIGENRAENAEGGR